MNIDNMTIGEAGAIASMFGAERAAPQDDSHWVIGKPVLIRTVTHIVTGVLEKITPSEFVLSSAAWIADTGRYAQAVASGEFGEVEPYPSEVLVSVGRGAMIDGTQIPKAPKVQK